MGSISFYLQYASRNIMRGGRWVLLAILCISAGVATVVALRSLGLAIQDTLVDNVRIENRGDVLLVQDGPSGALGFGLSSNDDANYFSTAEIERTRAWAQERGASINPYMVGSSVQITALEADLVGRPQFISSYFIDPEIYPNTHEILAEQPDDVPLHDLFGDGLEVVISENLASTQNIEVGDEVRVSGSEELFTVTGIVAMQHEAGLRNLLAAFFGFAYFDLQDVQQTINPEFAPNQMGVLFAEPVLESEIDRIARELSQVAMIDFPRARTSTYTEILERNEVIGQFLNDFIVVMGLGALLIGGVGIMNTMLVMVRRRTNEIAALKTFGLKGRQIAALFLTEALLLGLIGSILGSIVGIFLSFLANQYGSEFLQQQLSLRIYPEALVFGFALGLIITVVFGVAPILTAMRIRPNIILRPNENHFATLGVVQFALSVLLVVLAIGLIVGQIISPSFQIVGERADSFAVPSPYLIGVVGVLIALLVIGALILLFWVLVWLIGKLPTFGSVDLRLALRNLSTHRLRTATTLLALSAGMLALSSITFVGQGTRELLNTSIENQFGGNVLVFPLPFLPDQLIENGVRNVASGLEGVQYTTSVEGFRSDLERVDGIPIADFDFGDSPAPFFWEALTVIDSNNPTFVQDSSIVAGRGITEADRGQRVLVGPSASAAELGIQVGSILEYRVGGQRLEFEVIGLTEGSFFSITGTQVRVPPDSVQGGNGFRTFSYQIDDEKLNEALVAFADFPLALSLDVSFIDSLVSRIIDQFAAIPTIVGILSLFAAAVIMANTVALGTLERRTQIGVLKAVGLKSRRVLWVMLIETTIIGLLSAIIGLGLSSVFITLITSIGGTPIPLPQDARVTALFLLFAAIAISWIATFLSASVVTRERVMNVLRYE